MKRKYDFVVGGHTRKVIITYAGGKYKVKKYGKGEGKVL